MVLVAFHGEQNLDHILCHYQIEGQQIDSLLKIQAITSLEELRKLLRQILRFTVREPFSTSTVLCPLMASRTSC